MGFKGRDTIVNKYMYLKFPLSEHWLILYIFHFLSYSSRTFRKYYIKYSFSMPFTHSTFKMLRYVKVDNQISWITKIPEFSKWLIKVWQALFYSDGTVSWSRKIHRFNKVKFLPNLANLNLMSKSSFLILGTQIKCSWCFKKNQLVKALIQTETSNLVSCFREHFLHTNLHSIWYSCNKNCTTTIFFPIDHESGLQ